MDASRRVKNDFFKPAKSISSMAIVFSRLSNFFFLSNESQVYKLCFGVPTFMTLALDTISTFLIFGGNIEVFITESWTPLPGVKI